MTTCREPPPRESVPVHAEGPGGALLAVESMVPAHLLDGGEVVHFAIKPSFWFVPLTSLRWVAVSFLMVLFSNTGWVPSTMRWYLTQFAVLILVGRMGWATLDWVSRLYVLTNRRVMRIRGVFTVDLYECALERIQNTLLNLSLPVRLTWTGTIAFQTAGSASGLAAWETVARPLEVHERLREAIRRANHRGHQGI